MKILDWITKDQNCNGCDDFFPKSVLITMNGYEKSRTYCTCCAQEILEDEMED